jgi:hypothetical protein
MEKSWANREPIDRAESRVPGIKFKHSRLGLIGGLVAELAMQRYRQTTMPK